MSLPATRPERAASGICPLVSGPDCGSVSSATVAEHGAAVWRATAQAAPSAGTRKPARGATYGDTHWRRGYMHFSPERARAVRRAPARPEWSVASDAEGGSGERREPFENHRTADVVDEEAGRYLADSERARPSRSSPDPASTAGTRRAAVVAGRRAAEGFPNRLLPDSKPHTRDYRHSCLNSRA